MITCPTVECVNHAHVFDAPLIAAPGPVTRMVSPPVYCGGCGALMTEEEES